MNNKPKIDIIGSCVSRDVFNGRFNSDYKEHVEVGETIYQVALPSIVEDSRISAVENTDNPREVLRGTLNEEYAGNILNRLMSSRPDFIIMDFFADIHFGVTRKMGRYITRNHMAFQTLDDADIFYGDQGCTSPERMRFGDDAYRDLAVRSLGELCSKLRDRLPRVEFIVNSARFSPEYFSDDKEIIRFQNYDRSIQKNDSWAALDEIAVTELDARTITHNKDLLIATPDHPWGLHPVHYIQPYYDNLWSNVRRIIED